MAVQLNNVKKILKNGMYAHLPYVKKNIFVIIGRQSLVIRMAMVTA
jgi:hypothetical protein